jgi:hypothetical protein
MVGLHAYLIINEPTNRPPGLGGSKAEILADGLQAILFDAGTLFAFAGIVFPCAGCATYTNSATYTAPST